MWLKLIFFSFYSLNLSLLTFRTRADNQLGAEFLDVLTNQSFARFYDMLARENDQIVTTIFRRIR